MAAKAKVYQAQGDLQKAGTLLVEINAQNTSGAAFDAKLAQLRLERNHGEAVRLLQAGLTQFHFGSEMDKPFYQIMLAFAQHFAGDSVSAKLSAQQARSALELLCKNQPDNADLAAELSLSNAVLKDKDSALKEAQRAIMLRPSAKDRVNGPSCEENLAIIQTFFGENSRAIATLARLLQTPYNGWIYQIPITPAFLRLDPLWDPLRGDPAFQKLCEENQPLESPRPLPTGIAVPPFENLSTDPDNAFFADGVQDEVLNNLAKIADLKVISRTSVMQYRSGSKRSRFSKTPF
jgi:hypothetical protein